MLDYYNYLKYDMFQSGCTLQNTKCVNAMTNIKHVLQAIPFIGLTRTRSYDEPCLASSCLGN